MKYTDSLALRHRFFPESNIGNYSHADAGVALFTRINAVLKPTDHVLDFGAGRGEQILDDGVEYRRNLLNLRGRCAHVEGCDLDDAVLTNPFLDHATVIEADEPLPFSDNSFDIIFARSVFEHIEDPQRIGSELLRILKPGGLIAALTPNKFGYIAIAATAVPNKLHVAALKYIQPTRKSEDVFPTLYRLNTARAAKRAFGEGADTYVTYVSGEPAYHFGNPLLYRITKGLHKFLPQRLQPFVIIYARKHQPVTD